jgi:hypothetical protein
VNEHESPPPPEKAPDTQSATSGGPPDPPPRPPKLTAKDLLEPEGGDKTVFVPAYIEVSELAQAMKLRPFKVVADLMELKIFKHADELIDFETAANIAQKHGFQAKGFM